MTWAIVRAILWKYENGGQDGEETKGKVLMVDDHPGVQKARKWFYGDRAVLLLASTKKEAWELFLKNSDIDVIVMDGCLESGNQKPDTMDLIRDIRAAGFKGHMVAASGMSNEPLMEAGCDIDLPKLTSDFNEKLFKILGIEF